MTDEFEKLIDKISNNDTLRNDSYRDDVIHLISSKTLKQLKNSHVAIVKELKGFIYCEENLKHISCGDDRIHFSKHHKQNLLKWHKN